MNLVTLENEIKSIVGFKSLYHRAEDFRQKDNEGKPLPDTGRLQIYTMWQEVGGAIKNHRIDILVLNKGTSQEVAEPMTPLSQFSPVATPFLDELVSKIPAYQAAHSEIEKIIVNSCDEVNRMAHVTTYEYDAATEITTETKKIVYEVAGALTIRNFNSIAVMV